eukprot:6221974-Ditylum_brightwellii.AAC.1
MQQFQKTNWRKNLKSEIGGGPQCFDQVESRGGPKEPNQDTAHRSVTTSKYFKVSGTKPTDDATLITPRNQCRLKH